MIRTSYALLVPIAASLLSGCMISLGDDDESPNADRPVGSQQSDLNESGCVPEGVTDNHALCLCGDFDNVGRIHVQGSNGYGASVGVNGETEFVNSATIDGSWIAYGGFDAVTSTHIRGDLQSAQSITWVGDLQVDGDLIAGGSVDGVGDLSVGGSVRAAGSVEVLGFSDIGGRDAYPGVAPPCGCEGRALFSVQQAVVDAKSQNDNAAAELSPEGISLVGAARIALSSGRYYIESIDAVGDLSFEIDGDVALFIGGDMSLVGSERFTIREGGTLDLYVGGSVSSVGNVEYGSAADPSAFRLLIGGSESVLVSVGNQTFYGQIFAPHADIDFVGDTHIDGSLFGRELVGVGELVVQYAGPIETAQSTCVPPEEEDAPGDDDPAGAGGSGTERPETSEGGAGGAGHGGSGGDCDV